jgi:hypothetical protein
MLYSYAPAMGELFFGDNLPACNLYQNEEKFKELCRHLNAILRYNV